MLKKKKVTKVAGNWTFQQREGKEEERDQAFTYTARLRAGLKDLP